METDKPLRVTARPREPSFRKTFAEELLPLFANSERVTAVATSDGLVLSMIWEPDLEEAFERIKTVTDAAIVFSQPVIHYIEEPRRLEPVLGRGMPQSQRLYVPSMSFERTVQSPSRDVLARTMRATALSVLVLAVGLVGCGSAEEPTLLPVPAGAIEVKQVQLMGGRAHQTYFTMQVRFPGNPALQHYSRVVKDPWVRCDWSPDWQRFLDGTVSPIRTVHQQMYMWINRTTRRTLLLANRYYSSEHCIGNPENDDQEVIVVEYMGQDIDDTIATLKLKCPVGK